MLDLLRVSPLLFLLVVAGLIIAVTIHEFAHAFAADRLGDPTPKLQGRLTLNPLAHLDPLGTLMLLLVGFGWGKPVQFDPFNLKDRRRDAAIISFAGPLSNIIVATILAIVLRLLQTPFSPINFAFNAFAIIISLNVTLAVFNLIPIHPLDGSKVLAAFLPAREAHSYERFMNQYGMFVLLFLVLPIFGGSAPIRVILDPIISTVLNLLLPIGTTV